MTELPCVAEGIIFKDGFCKNGKQNKQTEIMTQNLISKNIQLPRLNISHRQQKKNIDSDVTQFLQILRYKNCTTKLDFVR
jgi:hypothetical protein